MGGESECKSCPGNEAKEIVRECSTVGSAFALHARGHEFESRHFQKKKNNKMGKKIRKDRRRRQQVEKHWKERRQRKAIAEDQRRPKVEREEAKARLSLEAGKRDQSMTRIRNRCVDTGNPRSVIRWFRRSGLRVRERALAGYLPGVYKISW
jgi:small subunit ribosomal protein S14